MIYAVIGLGAALAALLYVLWNVYRGIHRLLEDPDTWKLLDGKDSE